MLPMFLWEQVGRNLKTIGERQGVAQKGVRAIDARKAAGRSSKSAAKTIVRACGQSAKVSVNTLLCDTLWFAETSREIQAVPTRY